MKNKFEKSLKEANQKEIQKKFKKAEAKGITLIALVVTILFSYDEKLKCSNSKGFLLATI